jgi:hypothetical protein
MAGCSSLSESAYLGRDKQLAKIIRQQTAIKHKILDIDTPPYCRHELDIDTPPYCRHKLDIDTPPYCRHKSEPVLESDATILCVGLVCQN